MASRRVVVIEGDDAAPEAVRPTLGLREGLGLDIAWLHLPYGNEAQATYGTMFPEETRRTIDTSDTALFGATSGSASLVLHYLRWGKETYANVRPARWLPGFQSPLAHPEGIDFVILRENLEDLATGVERDLEALRPIELHNHVGWAVADIGPGQFAVEAVAQHL